MKCDYCRLDNEARHEIVINKLKRHVCDSCFRFLKSLVGKRNMEYIGPDTLEEKYGER